MTQTDAFTAPSAARTTSRLVLACGGAFVGFLDSTVTNLAVPNLADDFGVGVAAVSWVVTLYAILFAALLAPGGALADLFGRERLFLFGTGLFALASLLVACAPDFATVLIGRGVQGAGAALLIPASLAFVLADSPPERRPAAIGLWSASASVAAAIGPVVGGLVVDVASWRWLFLLNVPICAWLLVAGRRLRTAAGQSRTVPDLVGAAGFAGAVGLLVLGIAQGQSWGWGGGRVIGCFAAAVVLAGSALLRGRRHPSPAVDVRLWRSRMYAAANLVSLLFGAALYAVLLAGVLFLVEVWHYSTLRAGLAVTPGALTSALVGVGVSRLRRRPSPAVLVGSGGVVLTGVGVTIALALRTEPQFLALWLPTGLALGVGIGAVSVGVSTAAALSVPPVRFAAATGLNIAARQVGGAIGVALMAAVLAAGDGGVGPYRTVYWLVAAACLGAAVLATRLRAGRPVPSAQAAQSADSADTVEAAR
jgi:EmrB/QacA subfamily drug resistance transporter